MSNPLPAGSLGLGESIRIRCYNTNRIQDKREYTSEGTKKEKDTKERDWGRGRLTKRGGNE
jgi:hypothetical protein